jgi:hypothetical protein
MIFNEVVVEIVRSPGYPLSRPGERVPAPNSGSGYNGSFS